MSKWDNEYTMPNITVKPFKQLPDVVTVVRCDKCKKWEPFEGEESGYGVCTFWSDFIKKQENISIETFNECFCCWGKKREQEEE